MKINIHPQQFEARVTCSCGNIFTTASTKQEIRVEVCYKCHPFFTGEARFIDSKGRVDTFQKKQKAAAEIRAKYKDHKSKKESKKEYEPKTLKELLGEM
jgi:large subunit ribosomal protein L31